jgi:threonine/homoserine/homoserine lactone efflux protein
MEIIEALKFMTAGALLGLAAGISPGPLLALMISETIRHNSREGIKVALSPLITDIPIILLSYFVFFKLSGFDVIISVISLAGGTFIAYLGFEALKTKGIVSSVQIQKSGSLRRGVIANFLNPHPYLFWVTVGMPLVIKASAISPLAVSIFFLSFYLLLFGSKIVIVMIVARSRNLMGNGSYIWMMRILGVILIVFSSIFFYEGFHYFQSK